MHFVRSTPFNFFNRKGFGISRCKALLEKMVQSLAGEKIHDNFVLQKIVKIKELNAEALHMEHEPTGATIIHVSKAGDTNCTFSVGLKTFPENSNGVAHVLEHTALCGSKKYPVRDPFFKMLDRSLSTYMNAWTASDWTMYPFSTQNIKDFENLLNVYLDAVFHPLLSKKDFSQEGWRLERRSTDSEKIEKDVQIAENKNKPSEFEGKTQRIFENEWEIKGVVYNEMKGAHSDPNGLFSTRQQQFMFPGTTYSSVSGGEPILIPQLLTHEGLVDFHRRNYAPSNALLYSYGDMNLQAYLSRIDPILREAAINKNLGDYSAKKSVMDGFKRFEAPRRVDISCAPDPFGDPNRQTKVILSFLANETLDIETTFRMGVLAALLIEGPAAPLHKALIDSNLGSEYAPGSGYDSSTATSTFSVGLQGVSLDQVEAIENIILDVIKDCAFGSSAELVFSGTRVEGLLHQSELDLKYHSAKCGLDLAQRVTSAWAHGSCPIEHLCMQSQIDSLRSEISRRGSVLVFSDIVKKYLVDNVHRLTLVMTPSLSYSDDLKVEEAKVVESILKLKTEEELNVIDKFNEELKAKPVGDDKSLLPCLNLEDIPISGKNSEFIQRPSNIFLRSTPLSSDLVYFKARIEMPQLPNSEIALLPLLSKCLTSLGVEGMTISEYDELVRTLSAGLSISILNNCRPENHLSALCLSTRALSSKLVETLSLFVKSIRFTNWADSERIKSTLASLYCNAMNSIPSSGHSYAISLAASSLSQYRHFAEITTGITQVAFLAKLHAQESPITISDLAQMMNYLSRKVILEPSKNKDLSSFAVIMKEDSSEIADIIDEFRQNLFKIDEFISVNSNDSNNRDKILVKFGNLLRQTSKNIEMNCVALKTPFGTNYVGSCILTDPNNILQSANLAILAKLLPSRFLHREIREIGGAYGGGARYSTYDGLFSLFTYRDPNPVASLETFGRIGSWLADADLPDQDILEAKLSFFSEIDKPLDLNNDGLHYFFSNITDSQRDALRNAVFSVSAESIRTHCSSIIPKSAEDLFSRYQTVVLFSDENMVDELKKRTFDIKSGFDTLLSDIE